MKYCLKCGRTLFDKDENCDKCNSNNFISEEDVNKIVEKINKSNKISLKFLLKNSTYKAVFDLIINKPIDYFSYDAIPIHKKYKNTHHFKDLDETCHQSQPDSNTLRCPKCGSTAITTGSRGINWFWGTIGSGKTVNRCGKCGYTWKPNGR